MELLIGLALLSLFIWLFKDLIVCRKDNKRAVDSYFEYQDKVVDKAVKDLSKEVLVGNLKDIGGISSE